MPIVDTKELILNPAAKPAAKPAGNAAGTRLGAAGLAAPLNTNVVSNDGGGVVTPGGGAGAPSGGAAAVAKPVVQAPAGEQLEQLQGKTVGAGAPQKMTYADMYRVLNPYTPPTAEEVERQRKKEKRDKVFAAIGDGVSALSNLYFTTQGAPSAFDGRSTMSGKMRERYDKLQKERETNHDAWLNGYMKARKMDDEQDYKDTMAEMKRQAEERQRHAQEKKDAYTDAKIDYLIKQGDAQELKNEKARLENELAAEMNPLKVEKIKKQIAKIDNDIHNSNLRTHHYISGGNGGRGGSGSGGKGDTIVTPEGTYQVPTGFVAKNRGALMKAAGVSATVTTGEGILAKTRNKTAAEIDRDIMAGWNDRCTEIMVNGGRYVAGSNKQVQPGSNAAAKPGGKPAGNVAGTGQGAAGTAATAKGAKKQEKKTAAAGGKEKIDW